MAKKAKDLLENSGRIFSACIDGDDPQIGSQLFAQGMNSYYYGNYEEALDYEQKSYDMFMRLNGEVNSDTNDPMRMLAKTLSKLGRVDEALAMQNRVISAREKLWDKQQFNYFSQLEVLADIYFENGNLLKGIQTLRSEIELMLPSKDRYSLYFDKIQKKLNQYAEAEAEQSVT